VEESFGFYNTGHNPLDSDENYKHHIDSEGIATLGLEYYLDQAKIESWSYVAEGVFSLSMLQATGNIKTESGRELFVGNSRVL